MSNATTLLTAGLSQMSSKPEQSASCNVTECCESPLLSRLLAASILHAEDWDSLPVEHAQKLARHKDERLLLQALEHQGLLTRYQAARLRDGLSHGLILGNYRILDRIGAGGMGIVYRAEHIRLRRQVAIKVLAVRGNQQRALLRFYAEMRAVARLNHPNVVCAIDAGKVDPDETDGCELHYYVMEYIPGADLERLVETEGPLPVALACSYLLQVANVLVEADKHSMVHRDIKPSNILITPEGEAKLLDFGLVQHIRSRITDPHTALGTIDFMAPEQASDAGGVDIRADIYGLGATLYWCLTGQPPFGNASRTVDLVQRMTQEPPAVRTWRAEIPRELESIVQRLLAPQPIDRYQTPAAVVRAISPFCGSRTNVAPAAPSTTKTPLVQRVLVVDDDPRIRSMCRITLEADGFACAEAENGARCLEKLDSQQFDLIVLDIDMPEMDGKQVLAHLRENAPCPHLKIIMMSGRSSAEEMARMLLSGADDYLAKPFAVVEFACRVKAALRMSNAEQRNDLLQRQLLAINAELEENLSDRSTDLLRARDALVQSLTKAIELRGGASAGHLRRLPAYCRCLAEEAARFPGLAEQIDRHFIEAIEYCAPLHDLGQIALPDHILFASQALSAEDQLIMQSHTALGANLLREVGKQQSYTLAFLSMAIDVARHHHERHDGDGYPDRLKGTSIPLAARIVALAGAYDSLRRRQHGRPPLGHADAVKLLAESGAGQFDPTLMQAFATCARHFEDIFSRMPE